jgi:hypothetical protein
MISLKTRKTIASDFGFVYSLYQQTLAIYSQLQEKCQHQGMQEDFDSVPFQIVSSQGEDIGAIAVTEKEDALEMIFLAILLTKGKVLVGSFLKEY